MWVARNAYREIARKTFRTAFPTDEDAYKKQLQKDLNDWHEERKGATNEENEIYLGRRRLDYIHYEEAYCHLLLEDYGQASALFAASVDAGFRAIGRAADPAFAAPELLQHPRRALANIWIAGLLQRSAELRGL
ncbi:MAG TPA: hypothetical protein VIY30_15740, partial [Burkholderiaceae bacterium]